MKIDPKTAALWFAQLGNLTRMEIVRLLVRAGAEGLTVGEIQRRLGVPGSTLSHHLSHLRHAGLIVQERQGTALRCRVDFDKLNLLHEFLMEECCQGVDDTGACEDRP